MKFVDRTKELHRIERLLDSPDSHLIVLYGRRRVGKSTLVKKVFGYRNAIYFQADETQLANQLYLFSKSIAGLYEGFDKVIYPDWETLLDALNRRIEEKICICLDEFPYLVKSFPALPSVIQNFWDNKHPRFDLILCGSSQQLMYTEIMSEKSPLYGRADCIIKLQPISVGYISEAMWLRSPIDAIKYYSVWGGIPRYWQLCLNEGNFDESFRNLLLEADSTLADEPNRLLRDDMRDLLVSRTILSVIGDGANRISEIATRIGRPTSELSGPMKKLIDMGYIERENPFGESPKKSKKTLYKIRDPFMATYYRFIAPNASLISLGRTDTVWLEVEKRLPIFIGQQWESLCREAVSGNEIDGVVYGAASRWWGSVPNKDLKVNEEVEIDVMAESLDGTTLLVGECKWTAPEDSARVLATLKEKFSKTPFADKYSNVNFILFLKLPPTKKCNAKIMLPADIVALSK